MRSILNAIGVSFEFSNGHALFQNLNLSLEAKIYGLVGPNGIGKTSLARLLAGELEPSSGVIHRHGSCVFFPQRMEPTPISIDDFLGCDHEWSLLGDQLLESIDRKTLCSHLSGGQWMRVRLAHALKERFLILDEPTNDLDREGREALLRFLRGRTEGALIISHDRECLSLCDEILELSQQGLSKFGSGWAHYQEMRDQEREGLNRVLENAKNAREAARKRRNEEKNRQEKRNRQGAAVASRGGMPKILLGARKRQAQVTSGKIDASTFERTNDAVRVAHEALNAVKIDPVMYASLLGREIPEQKLILELKGFNIRFDDWIYKEDLSLLWRGNIRLAIKGANGSGKSSLLKALLGSPLDSRGEIRRGDLHTLYIDQNCSSLNVEKSILANAQEISNKSECEIRNGLAKFLFMGPAVFQKIKELSGGERLRAVLACGLLREEQPELLLLDEPTNNLDLANIEFLEKLARGFRGALIVISHDEVFLENCGLSQELRLP